MDQKEAKDLGMTEDLVEELKGIAKKIAEDIHSFSLQLTALETRIGALESKSAGDISNLGSKIDDSKKEITALKKEVSALKSGLGSLSVAPLDKKAPAKSLAPALTVQKKKRPQPGDSQRKDWKNQWH